MSDYKPSIKLTPFHRGIEDVQRYEKSRIDLLRQANLQYMEDDYKFNTGFSLAWRALQGALHETAIDNVTRKKFDETIAQLQAETATLESELTNAGLRIKELESGLESRISTLSKQTTLDEAIEAERKAQQQLQLENTPPAQTLDEVLADEVKPTVAQKINPVVDTIDIGEPKPSRRGKVNGKAAK